MKFNYDQETDSLYIDFSAEPSVDTIEISEGVLADYAADGRLVGLDIDHASKLTNLSQLIWEGASAPEISLQP